MPEVLYIGQLTGPELTQLIQHCTFQSEAYFLGEQLPTHMVSDDERKNLLCFTRYAPAIPFDSYTTGRVFQPDSELRWEREGNQFRVVYLGSEQNEKVLQSYRCKEHTEFAERTSKNELKKRDQTKTYFLFGKFLDAKVGAPEGCKPYAEARIARILYYPLTQKVTDKTQPATRVGIKVAEYIDSESGQIFAYRFQSLAAMD
jgi:hypothetical protein